MRIRRLKKRAVQLEYWLLVLLFCSTLVLAFGQILLRSIFNTTFPWTDPAIRHLVLWVGLWGALWTTRNGNHLKIEIAKHWLPPLLRLIAQLIVSAFSSIVCLILSWQSIRFLRNEITYGTESIGGVELWVFQLVFPAVFTLMAIHFIQIIAHCVRVYLRPDRHLG